MQLYSRKLFSGEAPSSEDREPSELYEPSWSSDTLAFYGPDSRSILISEVITEKTANCINSQIMELSARSITEPIHIYMNTYGGDIVSGLAIYDMMKITPCPVVCVVVGACYSAGLFILQGADLRSATPNSKFFYHEPVHESAANTEHAMETLINSYKVHNTKITDILLERSRMSKTVWKRDFASKTAYYFSAQQALDYKLIDELIPYAKPKPLKYKRA